MSTTGPGSIVMRAAVDSSGASSSKILIEGNTMVGAGDQVVSLRASGAKTLDVTLKGNTITATKASPLFGVNGAAGNGGGQTADICIHYDGNSVTFTSGGSLAAYNVEQFSGSTFEIQDLSPSPNTNFTSVGNHITSENTTGTGRAESAFGAIVVNYTNATCATVS